MSSRRGCEGQVLPSEIGRPDGQRQELPGRRRVLGCEIAEIDCEGKDFPSHIEEIERHRKNITAHRKDVAVHTRSFEWPRRYVPCRWARCSPAHRGNRASPEIYCRSLERCCRSHAIFRVAAAIYSLSLDEIFPFTSGKSSVTGKKCHVTNKIFRVTGVLLSVRCKIYHIRSKMFSVTSGKSTGQRKK